MIKLKNLRGKWYTSLIPVTNNAFDCGFCGSHAGPSQGFKCEYEERAKANVTALILLCPRCNKPTFMNFSENEQVPGVLVGDSLNHLPQDIEQLYEEARKCISFNANTSAVLSCRKLLMNVSVAKGAVAGKSFAFYVNFLEDNHYIPPGSKDWVDHIRQKGNEATHEIPSISQEDAVELMEFTEMLLRFVYELPGKMLKYQK